MRKDNINLSVSPPLGGRFTVELTRRAARCVFCFVGRARYARRAQRRAPSYALCTHAECSPARCAPAGHEVSSRRTRGLRKHFNPYFPSRRSFFQGRLRPAYDDDARALFRKAPSYRPAYARTAARDDCRFVFQSAHSLLVAYFCASKSRARERYAFAASFSDIL